jgi:hypothetical protein
VDPVLKGPSGSKAATKLLGWLAWARRPLKWNEIQGAFGIDLNVHEYDEEQRILCSPKDIIGPLIEVHSSGSIMFFHSSLRRYSILEAPMRHKQWSYKQILQSLSQTLLTIEDRFLIDEDYITTDADEITRLCLGYFNLRCLNPEITEEDINAFAMKGSYAFLDYAVQHWMDHLEKWVAQPPSAESIAQMSVFLGKFPKRYELKAALQLRELMSRTKRLSPFSTYPFVCKLVSAIYTWKQGGYLIEAANQVSLSLMEMVFRVRRVLEHMATSSARDGALRKRLLNLYGPRIYKCDRLDCMFFHEGFLNKQHRDQHVTNHQKPFLCAHSGCPFMTLGFVSAERLDQHISRYHNHANVGQDSSNLKYAASVMSSYPPSISSRDYGSTQLGNDSLEERFSATEELVALLANDDVLMPLYPVALQSKRIGAERFKKKFRRLLKIYSTDLMKETQDASRILSAQLVRAHARHAAAALCARYDPTVKEKGELSPKTAKQPSTKMEKSLRELKLSNQADSMLSPLPQPSSSASELHKPVSDDDTYSDPDSVVSSDSDPDSESEEHGQGINVRTFAQAKTFMVSSQAFEKLRNEFRLFAHGLHPSPEALIERGQQGDPHGTFVTDTTSPAEQVEMETESRYVGPIWDLVTFLTRILFSLCCWSVINMLFRPRTGHERITWICVSCIPSLKIVLY